MSFRFRLIYRLQMLMLFGAVLAFKGWLGFEMVRALFVAFEGILIFVFIFWIFLLIVSLALGYLCLYCWTYRLELGDTGLQTRTIYRPILGLFFAPFGLYSNRPPIFMQIRRHCAGSARRDARRPGNCAA